MTNAKRPTAYRFGSFRLDLEQGVLLGADGSEKTLRPKSFALLQLLAENAKRLMSCEAIMDAMWPGTFVTENNVSQCIHEIRGALGPEESQMLRTVPRRGYRLTSDVVVEFSTHCAHRRDEASDRVRFSFDQVNARSN
jgi:DNA-binding winged helix-turn-helix (wHTH) protein